MIILAPRRLRGPSRCPYLPGQIEQTESFLADQVSAAELGVLLAQGWRRFGICFFRPQCPSCRQCIPLRIPLADFVPVKSMRRTIKRNNETRVLFGPLKYRPALFDIYRCHSLQRFGVEAQPEEFIDTFFADSCPGIQSEYFVDQKLCAVGFLDRADNALSSVYFVFDKSVNRLRPGAFSVAREIAYGQSLGLQYYYLGYYVPGNAHMAYKATFGAHEQMDWHSGEWVAHRAIFSTKSTNGDSCEPATLLARREGES